MVEEDWDEEDSIAFRCLGLQEGVPEELLSVYRDFPKMVRDGRLSASDEAAQLVLFEVANRLGMVGEIPFEKGPEHRKGDVANADRHGRLKAEAISPR